MHRKGLLLEIVLLMVLLLVAGSLGFAQDELTPLEQQMEDLETTTSDLRGLDELENVARVFPTRDDVREYLMDALDTGLTDEVLWRETQYYVAFDFLPPDVDLYQTYLDLYLAQIAGFYDPETGEMNVILVSGKQPGKELPLLEQIVYVHEFTHALQDQHFGLREIGLDPESEDVEVDPILAVQALIEGDATMVMNEYTIQATQEDPLGAALQILMQGSQTGGMTLPPDTPDIVAAELLYPYFDGLVFVQRLYGNGGWDMVNSAFTTNLPQSTEQILHPDRYLAADDPQPVTLKPVDAVLGADWQPTLERTMGEFYLRQYLLTQLDDPTAIAAAAGWGGDKFTLYTDSETGQHAWVMRIVWDTPQDAEEFAGAYATFSQTRFPSQAMNGACRIGETDSLCTVTDGDATLIAYAPDVDLAEALLATQQ